MEDHNTQKLVNPIDQGIKKVFEEFKFLKFNSLAGIFASTITAFSLSIVLVILVVFWIYGFIPATADLLWSLIPSSRQKMKELNKVEQAPLLIAMGIYFVVWLPFYILSIPIYILGIMAFFISNLDNNSYEKYLFSDINLNNTYFLRVLLISMCIVCCLLSAHQMIWLLITSDTISNMILFRRSLMFLFFLGLSSFFGILFVYVKKFEK